MKKKGNFEKGSLHLKEAGGGDSDNLTCNGDTKNNAAKQIKNLTTFIANCSEYIDDVCNKSAPEPPPENVTKPCLEAISAFQKKMSECRQLKNDGAKLCACLADKSISNNTDIINKCDCKYIFLAGNQLYEL